MGGLDGAVFWAEGSSEEWGGVSVGAAQRKGRLWESSRAASSHGEDAEGEPQDGWGRHCDSTPASVQSAWPGGGQRPRGRGLP